MINKDPIGKTAREQHGSFLFPKWVYHFESGDYRSPNWDEMTYQSMLLTQESNPVRLGNKGRRTWWLFRKKFYWEEQGYTADEVKARVTENVQGTPKPDAPSIALEIKQSDDSLEQSPVSSIASDSNESIFKGGTLMEQWEYLTTILEADAKAQLKNLKLLFPNLTGDLKSFAPMALMPVLNEYGAKGWELIVCHPYTFGENADILTHAVTGTQTWMGRQFTHTYFCVFKRRKVTSSE